MRWLTLTPVASIGARRALTTAGSVTSAVYPDSPEGKALRALRIELGLNIREAAKRMGLRASELSFLETGKATCDWEKARALLLTGEGAATAEPVACPLCGAPMECDRRYEDCACTGKECGLAGPRETLQHVGARLATGSEAVQRANRLPGLTAKLDELQSLADRVCTVADEETGPHPVIDPEEALTHIERELFERRKRIAELEVARDALARRLESFASGVAKSLGYDGSEDPGALAEHIDRLAEQLRGGASG